jgi:hypothetical protein
MAVQFSGMRRTRRKAGGISLEIGATWPDGRFHRVEVKRIIAIAVMRRMPIAAWNAIEFRADRKRGAALGDGIGQRLLNGDDPTAAKRCTLPDR